MTENIKGKIVGREIHICVIVYNVKLITLKCHKMCHLF